MSPPPTGRKPKHIFHASCFVVALCRQYTTANGTRTNNKLTRPSSASAAPYVNWNKFFLIFGCINSASSLPMWSLIFTQRCLLIRSIKWKQINTDALVLIAVIVNVIIECSVVGGNDWRVYGACTPRVYSDLSKIEGRIIRHVITE